jgi:ethanolamine utilization protein EutN
MQLARVIGHATSTVKHPSLAGWKLLVLQPLDAQGGPDDAPVLAIDDLGARRGDQVIVTSDGKAVGELMKSENTPVRYAVIGIVDG